MTVVRETLQTAAGALVSSRVVGSDLPSRRATSAPRRCPTTRRWPTRRSARCAAAARVFAGQRDDPFFIPLDRVFDTINLEGAGTGNMGGGIDTLAGYGVQSVVLQVPEAQVTRGGQLGRPARRPATRSSASGRRPSAGACR